MLKELNHPNDLKRTELHPFLVFIKFESYRSLFNRRHFGLINLNLVDTKRSENCGFNEGLPVEHGFFSLNMREAWVVVFV